jgi:hypothetical protein
MQNRGLYIHNKLPDDYLLGVSTGEKICVSYSFIKFMPEEIANS